jgi:hypothetical protein
VLLNPLLTHAQVEIRTQQETTNCSASGVSRTLEILSGTVFQKYLESSLVHEVSSEAQDGKHTSSCGVHSVHIAVFHDYTVSWLSCTSRKLEAAHFGVSRSAVLMAC